LFVKFAASGKWHTDPTRRPCAPFIGE